MGSDKRFFARVQHSGQDFILAFHHACALELRIFWNLTEENINFPGSV